MRTLTRNGRAVTCVSDQVVVKLTPTARHDPNALRDLLKLLPAESSFSNPPDVLGTTIINLPTSADVIEVARRLEDEDAVEYAEPNFIDSGS